MPRKLAWLRGLAGVRLHDAHARDVLRQGGGDEADALAHAAVGAVRANAEPHRRERHQRQDRERREREPPVEHEQDDGGADDERRVLDEAGDAVGDELVERLDVVRDAADDGAGAVALEVAEREPLQVREQPPAQVGENPLPDPAGEIGLHGGEAEGGEAGGDEGDHDPHERAQVAGLDALVDGELGEERRHQGDEREREQRDDGAGGARPVGEREPREQAEAAARLAPRPVADLAAALVGEVAARLPHLHADTPISWSSP